MKYIRTTHVDSITKKVCTIAPMRNGPAFPDIKGLNVLWADESTWPVPCNPDGAYAVAPKYYGTCDDDATGYLEEMTEAEFNQRKRDEFYARQPFASWVFDEETLQWNPPVPRPNDAILNGGTVAYRWDEETVNWVPLENQPA